MIDDRPTSARDRAVLFASRVCYTPYPTLRWRVGGAHDGGGRLSVLRSDHYLKINGRYTFSRGEALAQASQSIEMPNTVWVLSDTIHYASASPLRRELAQDQRQVNIQQSFIRAQIVAQTNRAWMTIQVHRHTGIHAVIDDGGINPQMIVAGRRRRSGVTDR